MVLVLLTGHGLPNREQCLLITICSKTKRLWRKFDFNGKTLLLCVSFYTYALAKSGFINTRACWQHERNNIPPGTGTAVVHGRLIGKIIAVALSDCYP
jgi:hypothetical protein